MPDVMPASTSHVVAVTTIKGGSGKTTISVCLAGQWLYDGHPTALIDCDPQRSARRWAFAGSHLELMRIETCGVDDADQLRQLVSDLQGVGFERVVIDTPGFEAPVLAAALEVADLALVPLKPSPVDYQVAADTLDMIASVTERRAGGKPLRTKMLLTQVIRRSVIARHMRGQLVEAGYSLLAAELAHRVAYTEAPFSGSTPGIMAPRSAAAHEIAQLAAEIDGLLKASR